MSVSISSCRSFSIEKSVKAKSVGYKVVFFEGKSALFSNFFPCEEVEHQGQTFDLGFEKACYVGQSFILGDLSDVE